MKKETITAAAVLCALGTGFLACALHTDQPLSLGERRPLAQRPEVSVQALASGNYMSEFETYALDQFPLREAMRQLKAQVQYYLLRQKDNNGVYQVDGSLSKIEAVLSGSGVQAAAEKLSRLRETYLADSRVFYSVVPDKNYYLAESNGYPHLDYERMDEILAEHLVDMERIDLYDCLSAEDYYKTDPHWRQEKLEKAAGRVARALGVSITPFSDYTQQTYKDFRGAYFGQSALPLEAEPLHYLTSETLEACTVHHYETGADTGVYETEKLTGKDPYDVFLGGADALETITNPNAKTDRELLVFRDSFGSSIVPLLVQDYQSVTLIDLRYVSAQILEQFIDFHGQDVLFLYSPSVYNHSDMLKT